MGRCEYLQIKHLPKCSVSYHYILEMGSTLSGINVHVSSLVSVVVVVLVVMLVVCQT